MKMKYWNVAYALALGTVMVSGSVMGASKALAQSAAPSKSPVNLSSDVKIERVVVDAAGKETITLNDPKDVIVIPGDRVVFTLNVTNTGAEPASGFRATNPIPGPVTFVSAREDWAEVSVDNGVNWGKLEAMSVKIKAADTGVETSRGATAEDVTHVRWVFSNPIAAGTKTAVSYRGFVK